MGQYDSGTPIVVSANVLLGTIPNVSPKYYGVVKIKLSAVLRIKGFAALMALATISGRLKSTVIGLTLCLCPLNMSSKEVATNLEKA